MYDLVVWINVIIYSEEKRELNTCENWWRCSDCFHVLIQQFKMNCSIFVDADRADSLLWEPCPRQKYHPAHRLVFTAAQGGEGWGERLCSLTCRGEDMSMSVWWWDLKIQCLVGSVSRTPTRCAQALRTALCCKHTSGWVGLAWH